MSTRNVLVVDSERNIRWTVTQALQSWGYQVESAATGEEGLLLLRASPFDLVFVDLKLSGMNGLEVLQRAKAVWPQIRVIVITSHGTVDNAVKAMKLGASDVIQKPFTLQELKEAAEAVPSSSIEERFHGYEASLSEARQALTKLELDAAVAYIREAIGREPVRPEAFNLLGVAVLRQGDRYKAQDYFRTALALDPTYHPALHNLEHSASRGGREGMIDLDLGAGESR